MNETVLITGSTSGIGEAFAHLFAKRGYCIILVSRDERKLQSQAIQLHSTYGIKVDTIAYDLSDLNAADVVFQRVRKLNTSIHILVNNAGFNVYGSFLETDEKAELEMMNLHMVFVTKMMKDFLPIMKAQAYGKILNVGSTGSYLSCPYDAVYAATKAYVLSVSKGINAELKGTGITITTLCPGSTKTQFANKANMENTRLFRMFVMSPQKVAEIGYQAMMKGKSSAIAGIYNKLLVGSSYLLPEGVINYVSRKMLS